MTNRSDDPSRIYIEPTNYCNLGCRTCMRNVWDESTGFMSESIYKKILNRMDQFTRMPSIFFGGFGEPLAHPNILNMVEMAKESRCEVELITNGTLLTAPTSEKLIELGLDRIWVSLDGSTPESYADVRLGDELPKIYENLTELNRIRTNHGGELPRLGIAFVAMKRNISDLPEVIKLGRQIGADRISVSNVLPHTEELRHEMLYQKSLYYLDQSPQRMIEGVQFPRMDMVEIARGAFSDFLPTAREKDRINKNIYAGTNTCPFIDKNSLSIRWDGKVSPCLPLMHTHQSYLDDTHRVTHAYSMGDLDKQDLKEIWYDPTYLEFREKLTVFDFSPCTVCNSCGNAESNLEDCFGNTQPTCGGCLWAQGFIQCP